MSNNVPITDGSGTSSIAAQDVGGVKYQQIEVVGNGGASVLNVNSDGSLNVRGQGSVATVIVGGSIAASFTPPANQSVSGTVQADIRGSVATVIIGGSVAVATGNSSVQVLNFPTNQNVSGSVVAFQGGTNITSVSGQVTVVSSLAGGIFPVSGSVAATITNTNLNVGGSVVAFQGAAPWSFAANNSSVISYVQNSVATVIIGGSIAASFTPPANQSVSGSVGISGTVSDNIVLISGSTPATIAGSIAGTVGLGVGIYDSKGSILSSANEALFVNVRSVVGAISINPASVSGTVGAQLQSTNASVITVAQSSTAVAIVSGSIAATFTPPANQSVSGTVQTDVRGSVATVIIGGSVAVATGNSSVQVLNFPSNQSVSGTVGASIIGQPNVRISDGASIATIRALPTNSALNVAIIDASGNQITTFGTSNQSVSGTVGVVGSVAVLQGTNPWTVTSSIAGGIFPISGSVAATVTNTNLNVGGSVVAFQGGTQITSIAGQVTVVSSLAGGIFPISGSVAAVVTNFPANQSVSGTVQTDVRGSVATVIIGGSVAVATGNSSVQLLAGTAVIGSVAVLQGTNPYIFTGSVQGSFSVASIVPVTITGGSIAGTYSEDTGHTDGDKGFFILGVRNDTLASVASADREYESFTVGPAGEQIVSNAPLTKWVQGSANLSTNSGGSVAIIASQGASIFTYVTGVQVANMGSASVLVTFSGATSSVIGYTIAPAGGGSNIMYQNGLKTSENGAFTASISGQASVFVSAQGFIAKI